MIKNYLATITIFIKDRHNSAGPVNRILNEEGRLIMSRMGVNVEPRCISNCLSIICLAVSGTKKDISNITARLNKLKGIEAETIIMK